MSCIFLVEVVCNTTRATILINAVDVKTHCLFGSSGALCLTRTCGLKAEPEEDIGNNREEVANQKDDEDMENINDEQGRAVRGRAI